MCRIPCFPLHHKTLSNILIFENLISEKRNLSVLFKCISHQESNLTSFCILQRQVYFLFCELVILRTKTIHLHTQLEPEMKQPHTHIHTLQSQCRLHRLHYSLVFPCTALLFQDMPFQAKNLIIYYRNFLKNSSIL